MDKAYTKITFKNNQAPALDADNLNSISTALDTIDNRAIQLNTDLADLGYEVNLLMGTISNYAIESNGAIATGAWRSDYDVQYAQVTQGKTYTMSIGMSQLICAFYERIPKPAEYSYNRSRTVQEGNMTVTAPINGYIAFRTLTGYEYPQIVEGTEEIDYVRTGLIANDILARNAIKKIINEESSETIITVGSGKNYTSLREALTYANQIASKKNKVTIEFYGGGSTYNVQNEITDADLSDSSFIGLVVKDFVKIKGMGGDFSQNIINLTLPTSIDVETRRRISTLNPYNGAELENLTIIGENVRYAVHDDYSSAEKVERTMKNLHVIAISTVNSRSWGAGYRGGNTWNFDNCIFENRGDDSSYSFSAHNTQNSNEPTHLNFFNCRFITPPSAQDPTYDRGVAFGSMSNNTNGCINDINFYGCDLERIVMYEENASAYGKGIVTRVRGFGNSISGFVNRYDGNVIRIYRSDSVDYSSRVNIL